MVSGSGVYAQNHTMINLNHMKSSYRYRQQGFAMGFDVSLAKNKHSKRTLSCFALLFALVSAIIHDSVGSSCLHVCGVHVFLCFCVEQKVETGIGTRLIIMAKAHDSKNCFKHILVHNLFQV